MMVPCEVIVRYYLPAIRYGVARELMERYGWTQTQVSEKLGITQAAVSKYGSGRLDRKAKRFAELAEVRETARMIAGRIALGRTSSKEVCLLCVSLRKKGKLCKLHSDMKKLGECSCEICLE